MALKCWTTHDRPKNCPPRIRRKHPGVTYPSTGYLQVRRGRKSASFTYAEHGVAGAHALADRWYQAQGGAPGLTTTVSKAKLGENGGGLVYRTYVKGGIEHYAILVAYRQPNGRATNRTFYLGTENTWTKARERVAHGVAVRFRDAYERWRREGGAHPDDTGLYVWSAAEH